MLLILCTSDRGKTCGIAAIVVVTMGVAVVVVVVEGVSIADK